MTLAHLTGGQYVPMVDANRLSQMIISGIREEISLDRLVTRARPDIAREMRRSKRDGVDDDETARRLQKLFGTKNMRVSQMNNSAGKPTRAAEESYSRCIDMSDMQQQYQRSTPPTATQSSTLDYNLQENTEVSLEQSKRIVQKAKNWDYSTDDESVRTTRRACKYGSKCSDHAAAHRANFTHPEDNTRPPCKYGALCDDDTSHHLTKYSHPSRSTNRSNRTECKFGSKCYDTSDYHRTAYAHPAESEDFNTRLSTRNNDSNRFSHHRSESHRIECKFGSKCRDQSDYHRAKYSHP